MPRLNRAPASVVVPGHAVAAVEPARVQADEQHDRRQQRDDEQGGYAAARIIVCSLPAMPGGSRV
jgi:hypothetical protein